MDEAELRRQARALINAGKLPNRRQVRTWGGSGLGFACSLCGNPIHGTDVEYELQFQRKTHDPEVETCRFHGACLGAWELERGSD